MNFVSETDEICIGNFGSPELRPPWPGRNLARANTITTMNIDHCLRPCELAALPAPHSQPEADRRTDGRTGERMDCIETKQATKQMEAEEAA